MATTNDAFSRLPVPAQGMSKARFIQIYNDMVKEDLRYLLYSDFEDTYTENFDFKILYPSKLDAELSSVAGSIEIGKYRYRVSFVQTNGEGMVGEYTEFVSVEELGTIDLTSIPTGDDSTLSRRIYRQKNGSGDWLLVTTIADNTTVVYSDDALTTTLGERAIEGWALPDDFYEIKVAKLGYVELEEVERINQTEYSTTYGQYEFWINKENRDSVSSQTICFPSYVQQQNQTLQTQYFRDLPDMAEGGDLPFPTALQGRMLTLIPLACAVYYLLLDVYGEDEHINKIKSVYGSKILDIFSGNIATKK